MKKAIVAGGALAALSLLAALAWGRAAPERAAGPEVASGVPTSAAPSADETATPATGRGLLYGRVTTDDGDVYQGQVRFGAAYGRSEEALWGNTFNGVKDGNPWVEHAPKGALPRERLSVELFGFELSLAKPLDLGRPFMVRFGDVRRIEARGRDFRVTLKSGAVVRLARYAADDFADGVRVWDATRGIVDLNEREVRSIEFLSAVELGADLSAHGPASAPLHGTVRTRQGDFTGLVQWDRRACLLSDELVGRTAEGEVRLRFDAVRSIERRSGEGALVTLGDGREVVLLSTRGDGNGNGGMYVDDARYGRVLVSWDAFERVDFTPAQAVPAYDDVPAGRPLAGTVILRSGRELSGRLVWDLDESETVETLDAPWKGVDYTIPFGRIAEVVRLREGGARDATVKLHGGEELTLERAGDLSEANVGILVFEGGGQDAEYVPWSEVARIRFEGPGAAVQAGQVAAPPAAP